MIGPWARTLEVPALRWLLLTAAVVSLLILGASLSGDLKHWQQLDWLDIVGEGGSAILFLTWIAMVLTSRPGGKVTAFFIAGLSAMFVSTFEDALDEIFITGDSLLHAALESVFMPVGMLLLTAGLYLWHKEQKVISRQLVRREQLFRQHDTVDGVTQIHEFSYLKKHLRLLQRQQNSPGSGVCLVLMDLQQFKTVNFIYGPDEGDRVLHSVAEFLLLNLRGNDLLCRFAGDRFALLLPNTDEASARLLATDVLNALEALAIRDRHGERIKLSAVLSVTQMGDLSVNEVIARACESLELGKRRGEKIIASGERTDAKPIATASQATGGQW